MFFSVIIPVKDDERLFSCLASLRDAAPEEDGYEVLVVANGVSEGFRERLRELPAGVRLLEEERPGAFAARNAAVREAKGEVLLFTDADCLIRPGWVMEARRGLNLTGADLLQGFSGSTAATAVARIIQHRYGAPFRVRGPGEAVECDTRNLAVRREVFERLRFNDGVRRAADTEFGLLAEVEGFRVSYWPVMRVDHAHEETLAAFIAKQVCHGWGAQRIMREHPAVEWHGGHLRLVAAVSRRVVQVPGHMLAARALSRSAVTSARGLQWALPALPDGLAVVLLGALDKTAALAGHLLYEAGQPEPLVSEVLGERHPRD